MRPLRVVHALNSWLRSRPPLSSRRTVNDGGTPNAGGVWKSPFASRTAVPVPGRRRTRVRWRFWLSGSVVDVVLVLEVDTGAIVLVVVVGPGVGHVASTPVVTSTASAYPTGTTFGD